MTTTWTSSRSRCSTTVRPVASASRNRACISASRSPWSTAVEEVRVRPKEGLILELEVLGQGHQDRLGSDAAVLWSQVGDVLLDGDRRERRRVDRVRDVSALAVSGTTSPRAGVPAATMPTPRTRTATSDQREARTRPARGSDGRRRRSSSRVANRPRSSAAERGSGRMRSRSGRAAQTTTRPASSATFVPNSFGLRRHEERARDRDEDPNTIRPTWPPGTVFGSVIMKAGRSGPRARSR